MSSRWLSTFNENNAKRNAIALVTLCELYFDSGTLYLSDGFGQVTWNGHTYDGLGDYGGFDSIQEMPDSSARGLQLTLSGVPTHIVVSAMNEQYQGREVILYVGLLDIDSMKWIDNPEVVWEGRMDFMTIDIEETSATMRMSCEHRLNKEPLVARYTDQDQQLAYPGDTFFDLIWQIPLSSASWGAVTVQHPKNTPSYGGNSVTGHGGWTPWNHP
jgi:hypothetical protein